jgi:hypothetical protein
MKNLDLKKITTKLAILPRFFKKYAVFIVFILVFVAYGFIVVRIRTLASSEPDEEVVTEQLSSLNRPSIDQSTINKIQQLQDTNIQVKSLFDHARDNPFQN